MITREQACDILLDVINSDILKEEIKEALDEIEQCLNMEVEAEISPWGMPDEDYGRLVVAMNPESPDFEEHARKCREIARQYRLKVGE